MTLAEAAAAGIKRVRLPNWADAHDYVKLDIIDGRHGPWGHLYAPCQADLGLPRPHNFLIIGDTESRYEPYSGPTLEAVSPSDRSKA